MKSFDNLICFAFGMFAMCFLIVVSIFIIDGFTAIWLMLFVVSFVAGYLTAKYRGQ